MDRKDRCVGVAIGGAAVLGVLCARWTVRRLDACAAPVRMLAGFGTAFTIYQLALYVVAASWLGGTGAFSPGIIGHVLLVNPVTLVGLLGLGHLVDVVGPLARRRRPHTSPIRLA